MDTEESFTSEEGALLRARLHIRAGKRRLRQGKVSAGIVTLYDALLFALLRFTLSPELRKSLAMQEGEDLKDERVVYAALVRSGRLDGKFDYEGFEAIVEKASNEEMPDYYYPPLLAEFEELMAGLGVMPFDEGALPPEDPSTF